MSRLIAPIVILQVFCLYHIYKNKSEPYWYIIILLFPLIGGIIYFYKNFVNRRNIELVKETSSQVVDVNHKLTKLQTNADFADTVSNKILLADEHMAKENYEDAISIYESCYSKLTEDDEELNKKMLVAYYKGADYLSAIQLGEKLNKEKHFQNSLEKTFLAWSYFELHDDEKAENYFQELNIPNTHFEQRKEFVKFLIEVEKSSEAKILIEEILDEISYMDSYEKKIIKRIHQEIKDIKKKLK